VDSVEHSTLLALKSSEETSQQIAMRVAAARQRQLERQQNNGTLNGSLSSRHVKLTAQLTDSAKVLLDTASAKLQLSARAYMRAVKVARTIADLAASENIDNEHIAEALQYRPRPINQFNQIAETAFIAS
jgi:magnesium chelatase family protein